MVVNRELEFPKCPDVYESKAISLALCDSESGLSRVVLAVISTVIAIRSAIKASNVSIDRGTAQEILQVCSLNQPIVRNRLSVLVPGSQIIRKQCST